MKNYLKLLLAALALLCSPSASAQYEDWTSTNTTTWSSSSHTWTIDLQKGQWLHFDYAITHGSGTNGHLSINGRSYSYYYGNRDDGTFQYGAPIDTTLTIEATFYTQSDQNSKATISNMHVSNSAEIKGNYISLYSFFREIMGFYASQWTSANDNVAKVTNSGEVYGFALGSTTITATGTKDGETKTLDIPVNVIKTGIDISGNRNLRNVFYDLTRVYADSWISADENIANVTNTGSYYDKGDVYGFSVGSTTITGTGTKDGQEVTISFPVNITKPYSWDIYAKSTELPTYFNRFTNEEATTLTSSDESIAKVIATQDETVVVGLSEGSAVITTTSKSGSSIAFPVTVHDPYTENNYGAPQLDGKAPLSEFSSWDNNKWNDFTYYGQSASESYQACGLMGTKDEYNNWYTVSDDLLYFITNEEYKSFNFSFVKGGDATFNIYLDGKKMNFSPYWTYTSYDGYKIETYDNCYIYLVPGNHTIYIKGTATNGFVGFTNNNYIYSNTYSIGNGYDELAQEVEMDTIHLSREGTLGGEALKLRANLSEFMGLYVSGPFDEYDWKTLREMTNLKVLDMTEVLASAYPTSSQNGSLQAVKLSRHIPTINYNPFTNVSYIYVPDEVTKIEKLKLNEYSYKLMTLEGCQGVKEIGNKAFSETILPKDVHFPSVEKVGVSAFENNIFIQNVSMPSATEIGESAFENLSLKQVSLPKATYIGKKAFVNTALTEINLPEAVTVDSIAFFNVPLQSVKLPKAKYINYGAFANGTISRQETWKSGYGWVWEEYYDINDMGIIEDIDITLAENIGDDAFYGNQELTTVKAGNIKNIGNRAFYNCRKLATIDLSKADSIGYSAFCDNATINNIDLSHITYMGDGAFSSCRNLKSIDISNLKTIPSRAFGGCSGLQSIDARRATEIGYNAFSSCNALETANLSKAEKIGSSAFYNCKLKEIDLPNVTSLGSQAFYGNSTATSIDLSDKLTEIGEQAFYGCSGVEELTLPASLRLLPSNCFSGSNNIKTINLNAPAPPAVGETPFTMQTIYTALLKVPSASMALYKAHDYWKHFYYWGDNPSVLADLILASSIDLGDVRMDKTRLTINPGISLTMAGTEAQDFRSVLFRANATAAGMFLSGCERITSDETSVELTMDGLKWYYIALPFDVTLSDIANSEEAQLAFYKYDGAQRAANGTGNSWTRLRSGQLTRGQGYIVQASKATTLTLPATYETKDVPFLPYDVTMTLEENASSTASNQGWNFLGNPYPTYFDIAKLDFTAPITVWTGSTYTAYSPEDDDFALAPLQPYFVQCPSGVERLKMLAEGRQVTSTITHANEVKAQQAATGSRKVVDIVLTDGQQNDRTRIVVNPQATDGYDLSRDAAKMMSTEEGVPQIYSMRDDIQYAINEGPQTEGSVELGLVLPTTGKFTLRTTRSDVKVWLTDEQTGDTVCLTDEDYTFEGEAGECEGRFIITLSTDKETAVEDIEGDVENGNGSNSEWYDLSGRRLNNASRGVTIKRQGTNVTKQLYR